METSKVRGIPVGSIKIQAELEYDKDIWDVRNLGIDFNRSRQDYKLNFTTITQAWLRQACKEYIRYTLATKTFNEALARLTGIRRFSKFLRDFYPLAAPTSLNRRIVVHFLSYLLEAGLAISTRSSNIGYLKTFFELCCRNSWIPITTATLIFREDYPGSPPQHIPRYIHQEVLDQLNQNLDGLPEPIMRMVLVIRECAMRISELCLLPFNCLSQDAQGDWFLRYYQSKMKKEIVIPVSREIVAVIQEQQQFIKETLGNDYPYLFSARRKGCVDKKFIPAAKPMYQKSFATALNRLAQERNICDNSGQLWKFETHQFRHTVATQMINSNVPLHIIQRYLGHESPDMTARYSYIHNQTLKVEVAKFHGKTVNIAGQIVESENPELDTTDLRWFKRNILAQALPNGSCALPAPMKECPHANACLTCTHFRTTIEFLDQHKQQLEVTEKIIEKAKDNNWTRQIEMNEKVAANLRNIINTLEVSNGN